MKIKYTTLVIILIIGVVLGYMKMTDTGLFKKESGAGTASNIPYLNPGLGQLPSLSSNKPTPQPQSPAGKEMLYTAVNRVSQKNTILDTAKKLHIYPTHYSEPGVGNVDMTVRTYKENDLVLFRRDLKNLIGARDMRWTFQTRVQEGVQIFEVYKIQFYY